MKGSYMNKTIEYKTVFPANTMVQIYRRPKPLENCFDLDDAYYHFRQMGFNGMLLEVGTDNVKIKDANGNMFSRENDEKISDKDYVLIVADYSKVNEPSKTDVLKKMSKKLNESGVESKSEMIEKTLDKMKLNVKDAKLIKQTVFKLHKLFSDIRNDT